MIHTPRTGAVVRVEPYRSANDLGVTRPAAGAPRSILTPYRAATPAR